MKKIIGIIIIVVMTVGIVTGCGSKKESEKTKENYNTNEGIVKDQEVGELKFTNTSLVSTKDNATLVTMVTNPTGKDIEIRIFNIYIKDKEGETITKLEGYVGGVIPAGESREITSNVDMNLDKAVNIEYEMVK